MADPANRADRWGRDYDLHHVGVQLRTQLGAPPAAGGRPYFQYRDIDHPIFQVINQQSRDYGAEVRYENTLPLLGRSNRFTLGVQTASAQHGQPAVRKRSRRARRAAQASRRTRPLASESTARTRSRSRPGSQPWPVSASTTPSGSRATNSSPTATSPTTGSSIAFLPKIGMLYSLPAIQGQFYANASRSYEPPLLLELNSLTVPGFVDLAGQDAWQFELGVRGSKAGFGWDIAAFDVELKNEILNINVQPFPNAPFTVPTYRNAPRTRHFGIETGLEYDIPGGLLRHGDQADGARLRLAYTFARYRFVDDPDFEGNDIPGAPEHHLQAELRYRHPAGVSIAPRLESVPGSYFINSANTASNEGWTTLGLRVEWEFDRLGLAAFASGQNLTDERYSASVQVDNAAGRSFEPADGRSFYLGMRWAR